MAKKTNDKKENGGEHRDTLSQLVVWFSVGGVIAVAILVMFLGSDPKRFELVLTATLPLFGAWVGTILAFYFGRTNFEAATRSVTE